MNVLNLDSIKQDLIKVAHFCATRGLVPATSGNFSARIASREILITVSGKDKAGLTEADLMLIDSLGRAKESSLKPSAESLLHTQIYRVFSNAQFIAHFHSSSSAVLSKVLLKRGIKLVKLEGFELLKALSGVDTHDHTEILPIFPNNQDIEDYQRFVDFGAERPGQDVRYALNDQKIRRLGWEPSCDFDTEIIEIVEYYKDNFIW